MWAGKADDQDYVPFRDRGIGDWQRIAYENLANAIIERACKDYVIGKRMRHNRMDSPINVEKITRFFKSQWFKELSDMDSDYLVAMLDKRVEDSEYNCTRIYEEKKEETVQEKIARKREYYAAEKRKRELKKSAEKMRSLWKDN